MNKCSNNTYLCCINFTYIEKTSLCLVQNSVEKSFLPINDRIQTYGVPRSMIEEVILQYDEYEVIRLLDYEGILQEQAAEKMNISRPTLTRIYENARKTIAKAFVEGKMIVI